MSDQPLEVIAAMAARPQRDDPRGAGTRYNTAAPRTGGRVVGEYVYGPEFQIGSYKVIRHEPKGFHQERWDDAGKRYLKGKPDEGWVCWYRQTELLERPEGAPVYIAEGEKDAETLRGYGLTGTTLAGGASMKWLPRLAGPLDGAPVVIFVDRDDDGERFALKIAHGLFPAVASLRLVRFPELPAKGDVSDYLASHSVTELLAKVEATPTWHPDDDLKEPLTDYGNARRLAARDGLDLRYIAGLGWFWWADPRWQADRDGDVMRRAKQMVRALSHRAVDLAEGELRNALRRWCRESESRAKLEAMIALATTEPEVVLASERLDADPLLLNVENGTLDLRTGKLRSARREDYLTLMAPVCFDRRARCPRWLRFLLQTFDRNKALIRFMQRWVGYCLTGLTREQVLLLLYGLGMNGKTTFLEVIRALMGPYARQTSFQTLTSRRDGPRNDLARLRGARLVTAVEADPDARLNEVVIKMITGEDTITARFLYQEEFEFVPSFKVTLAANHKPEIRGTDLAIWRRIKLVPFTTTVPAAKRDPKLADSLKQELPGILNWAVAGCLAWQKKGLEPPTEVDLATAAYREDSDPLAGFLADRCDLGPHYTARASELYAAYQAWAQAAGEDSMSGTLFGRALTERGIGKDKNGPGNTIRRIGIQLRPCKAATHPDSSDSLDTLGESLS